MLCISQKQMKISVSTPSVRPSKFKTQQICDKVRECVYHWERNKAMGFSSKGKMY
ncbi:unnamed protein product [Arabidopsis thaliana]|uniref:(thale cress) hypothetical protein n=1 Tax=Arabidopsis thaliana TaxID=3702 RepID=A0A178U7S9_ARATH|nr:hypothetical protein AXX17_AT5G34060 [Arabidopsis thaliana]CAD5333258.1 unnamed protein product [Arabidopsis thaliana]